MIKASVAPDACRPTLCPTCPAWQQCPTKALIRRERDEPAAVDIGRCRGCGKCVSACLWQAIAVDPR